MITTTAQRRAWVEQIMGLPVSIHLPGGELSSARVEQHVTQVLVTPSSVRRVTGGWPAS
jgi:hypothetical protein